MARLGLVLFVCCGVHIAALQLAERDEDLLGIYDIEKYKDTQAHDQNETLVTVQEVFNAMISQLNDTELQEETQSHDQSEEFVSFRKLFNNMITQLNETELDEHTAEGAAAKKMLSEKKQKEFYPAFAVAFKHVMTRDPSWAVRACGCATCRLVQCGMASLSLLDLYHDYYTKMVAGVTDINQHDWIHDDVHLSDPDRGKAHAMSFKLSSSSVYLDKTVQSAALRFPHCNGLINVQSGYNPSTRKAHYDHVFSIEVNMHPPMASPVCYLMQAWVQKFSLWNWMTGTVEPSHYSGGHSHHRPHTSGHFAPCLPSGSTANSECLAYKNVYEGTRVTPSAMGHSDVSRHRIACSDLSALSVFWLMNPLRRGGGDPWSTMRSWNWHVTTYPHIDMTRENPSCNLR